ncbi:hypothetical protein B4096_0081 [Heyndrickxia coagulans]|nr:hypothetical protein B4096_0081 [Heyndrickxia coagulans]
MPFIHRTKNFKNRPGLFIEKFAKASEKAGMLPAFLRFFQARSARQAR